MAAIVIWLPILLGIISFITGIVLGFVFAKKKTKKELKNNPIINKEQIKAMYAQMGRKPSEAQINQIMKILKKNN